MRREKELLVVYCMQYDVRGPRGQRETEGPHPAEGVSSITRGEIMTDTSGYIYAFGDLSNKIFS